jgi:hypothetical protein
MMIYDRKKAMDSVMARRAQNGGGHISGPAPMKADLMKNEDGELDGRHAAAQDLMSSIHEKSPHKMAQALSNFMEMHNAMKDSQLEPDAPEDT